MYFYNKIYIEIHLTNVKMVKEIYYNVYKNKINYVLNKYKHIKKSV